MPFSPAVAILACLLVLVNGKPVVKDCKPGYYFINKTICAKCPAGTYQVEPGQKGCIPCPAGTISDSGESISCTTCPLSTKPDASRTKCVCPEGFQQNDGGDCSICKPGTFYVKFGDFATCQPCQRDTYQPLPGKSQCIDCPKDAYSGDGAPQCTACSPGQVLLGGAKCGKCPAGSTYLLGPRECSPCNPGFFKASIGQGPCIRCPPRGFSGKGASSCKICPKGTALKANGKCSDCPAGSFYNPDSKTCSACELGTFIRERNAMTSCFACAGDSFSFQGATECITCPKNTALMKDGTCKACTEGEFYNTTDLKCEKCPINAVSDGGTMSFCFPCAGGSFAKPGSSICSECPSNKVLFAGTMQCETCPTDTSYDQNKGTCS